MLCFRCEHRAKFLETGVQPRVECGDVKSSKAACYMFVPTHPVVTKEWKRPEDKRIRFGGTLFGTREQAVRLADPMRDRVVLNLVNLKKGEAFLHWRQLSPAEWRRRVRKAKEQEKASRQVRKALADANKATNEMFRRTSR